jgi:DNA-binding NarL/FixJ family response regulator
MSRDMTILIVDDHPVFREGLKTILSRASGYRVAGEAGDGRQALELAQELKPDLVLLDLSLPDMSGIQLIEDLKRLLPDTLILVVSMHGKIDYLTAAFKAGARGYVVKESATAKLFQALDLVAAGEYFLDNGVSREVVHRLAEETGQAAPVSHREYATLTPREQEILRLLAEGHSPRIIRQPSLRQPENGGEPPFQPHGQAQPPHHPGPGTLCRPPGVGGRGAMEALEGIARLFLVILKKMKI